MEEEGYAITFYHAKISRKKLTSANPFDVRQSMDWVLDKFFIFLCFLNDYVAASPRVVPQSFSRIR